jgi:tetratricopeptide (TPR) repeat protein
MTDMSRKHEFEIRFFESILKRNPRYADVIELLGELYTRNGRISDGLRMDRRLVRLKPDNPTAYYNLACSLALKERKAEAMETLHKAISLGYSDYDWLMQDPDLDGLKSYPGFRKLLAEINPHN